MAIKTILKPLFFEKIREYTKPKSIERHWESIKIPQDNGNYLTARIVKPHNSTEKCIFLIHPYHKDAKDYFLYSGHPELYISLGFNVVIFDLNGFGESTNTGFDFDRDIQDAVAYITSQLGTTFNAAHGISFGAAMLLKALNLEINIQRAIIENCLDETPSYFKKRNKFLYLVMKILFFVVPPWKDSNQYFKVIKTVRNIKELCLIYNMDDDLTTPEMGIILSKSAFVDCQYHLIKGKHMQGINADRKKYINILDSYLKG